MARLASTNLLPPGRLIFLDALRGVAALAVVGFHLAWITPLREPLAAILPPAIMAIFEQGHAGVAVFFALSGFVIARSLSRADVDWPFFGRFALRRSIRLDPPYWCAVGLAALVFTLAAAFPDAPARPTLPEVAAHVVYLQDILGLRPLAVQFWTLPYELQFYLVACACLGLEQFLRRRLLGVRGVALAGIIVHAPLAIVSFALAMSAIGTHGWFLDLWYQFFLGALTCRMLEGRVSRAIWGSAIIVVAGGGVMTHSARVSLMVLTCVLIVVAAGVGRLTSWGAWRPLQWLGRISYSLYLTHFVGMVMCQALARLFVLGPWAAVAALLAGLVLSLSLAAAFHHFVEAPSLTLSRSPHPFRELRARLSGSAPTDCSSPSSDTTPRVR